MTDEQREQLMEAVPKSMADLFNRHRSWSVIAFGETHSLESILNHIRSKCDEIQADPAKAKDLDLWEDVIALAVDGAWRGGASPADIAQGILNTQNRNILRDYPSPGSLPPGTIYKHIPTQAERIEAGEITEEEAIQETERDRKE